MPKTRTTVTLEEDVFRALKIKAARTGRRDSEVIEEALRRDLGLAELSDIWGSVRPAPEGAGIELANSEIHAMRKERRGEGGP